MSSANPTFGFWNLIRFSKPHILPGGAQVSAVFTNAKTRESVFIRSFIPLSTSAMPVYITGPLSHCSSLSELEANRNRYSRFWTKVIGFRRGEQPRIAQSRLAMAIRPARPTPELAEV